MHKIAKTFRELHTRDIKPEVPGCEALGSSPSSEEIFDLYRIVEPNDAFAPQYLRDAATRLRNRTTVVVQWPDGVAAIVSGEQSREALIQAYWQAINRFVDSYNDQETPKQDLTATPVPRKKRRYTKRVKTAPIDGDVAKHE